jgi:hypothetical protein
MAKSKFAKGREYVRGAASRRDYVYILSKGKVLLKDSIAHTSIIGLEKGSWVSVVDTDWDSTAIAIARSPAGKIVVIGEEGETIAYGAGKSADEAIKPTPVLIRNARTIEGEVYACGMKRQVYRRTGERTWNDVSAPFPKPKEEVGFEAIDGYSHKEIYAVGWKGEIWQYSGKKWTNRSSPTSLIMTAVCCAGDDVVYVAGQQGVMIRGRNDEWEAIEWEDDVSDDLWDLCWFGDKLYVATMTGIYTLEGSTLEPVDLGDVEIATFYSLTTTDGVLWSIGRDDVASFDGTNWQRYD